MSRQVNSDLVAVRRKLERSQRLRPQESTDSLDSGICYSNRSSCNPSASSLISRVQDLQLESLPVMEPLGEDPPLVSPLPPPPPPPPSVQITIDEAQHVMHKDTGKPPQINVAEKNNLDILQPPERRDSTGSGSTSDDYSTPLSSPTFITRKIPISVRVAEPPTTTTATTSSASSEFCEDIHVKVEIDFLDSKERVQIDTIAKVYDKRRRGHLHFNFFLTPTSSAGRTAATLHQRSHSIPSAPNSPTTTTTTTTQKRSRENTLKNVHVKVLRNTSHVSHPPPTQSSRTTKKEPHCQHRQEEHSGVCVYDRL